MFWLIKILFVFEESAFGPFCLVLCDTCTYYILFSLFCVGMRFYGLFLPFGCCSGLIENVETHKRVSQEQMSSAKTCTCLKLDMKNCTDLQMSMPSMYINMLMVVIKCCLNNWLTSNSFHHAIFLSDKCRTGKCIFLLRLTHSVF